MADHRITVECDDRQIFAEFFVMFGGSEPTPGRLSTPADIRLDIHAQVHPDFGWFRMVGTGDFPIDAREYSLALELEEGFELLPTEEPGWKCIAFRGSSIPMF